ncbi:Fatty acid hydroxylase family (carotene hydroxylase/sterol desaturase) [hydrothermal vent metagenome]|uniref:Fatty acid hydroxylase family (Carotene hydroxylase/sterol desaturase) n=1 Tax=hydrothermal vent metagenome TaxID=652676 RepID=A0A3B0YS64_9ZZZZ
MGITEFIIKHEKVVRMSFFFGTLVIMAVWEIVAQRRKLTRSKPIRWTNNLGIVFLNSYVIYLLFPAAAVGVALFVNAQGWGLLNYYSIPFWIAVLSSVIILDLVIYLQHVMVHAIPVLWRLHRVHHADPDFDVTTGARFHPFEIVFSMLVKFSIIILLGPPIVAVIIFEVVLNASAMFNHSNIRLPKRLDRILRWIMVTPDMHRVHHSVHDDEANSNFGFNLPWWDRLFGTYKSQPRDGHQDMIIGIHHFKDAKQVSWLPGMLTLPFKGNTSAYVLNRRQWSDKNEN